MSTKSSIGDRAREPVVHTADATIQQAVQLASGIRSSSYSPYSNVPMSAAIIGQGRREAAGALVENVSRSPHRHTAADRF